MYVAIPWIPEGRRKEVQLKETWRRTKERERDKTLASNHGLTQPQRETDKDGGNLFPDREMEFSQISHSTLKQSLFFIPI